MSIVEVDIPETLVEDGVVFYVVQVKLPYKNYTVRKRFSEFQSLKQNLEILKLNKTIPYTLPSRFNLMGSSEKVVEKRRVELARFVNELLSDQELKQNHLVLDFLGLPKTVFMTENMNVKEDWLGSDKSIGVNTWPLQLKNVDISVKNLSTKIFNNAIDTTLARSTSLQIRKQIDNLAQYLSNHEKELGPGEFKRRNELLSSTRREFYDLNMMMKNAANNTESPSFSRTPLIASNKRVLGARETALTLPLNNAELYQQQQLQMQKQDQDIDQIRSLIQRQREIANVINNEVQEQNEILDTLAQEVDESSQKMRIAKKMTRKIG